jgi:hypothetical protein
VVVTGDFWVIDGTATCRFKTVSTATPRVSSVSLAAPAMVEEMYL